MEFIYFALEFPRHFASFVDITKLSVILKSQHFFLFLQNVVNGKFDQKDFLGKFAKSVGYF